MGKGKESGVQSAQPARDSATCSGGSWAVAFPVPPPFSGFTPRCLEHVIYDLY